MICATTMDHRLRVSRVSSHVMAQDWPMFEKGFDKVGRAYLVVDNFPSPEGEGESVG